MIINMPKQHWTEKNARVVMVQVWKFFGILTPHNTFVMRTKLLNAHDVVFVQKI